MSPFPCGCCEELPCEEHMFIVQAREGASLRTADELMLQFVDDGLALGCPDRVLPEDDQAVVDLARQGLAGQSWLDDRDLADALVEVAQVVDGLVCEAGLSVHWEDGFLLYRVTGGPLAEEVAS